MMMRNFLAVMVVGWGLAGVAVAFTPDVPTAAPSATVQGLTRLQQRGAALRAYRTAFALTQTQLAGLSGLPATKISRIERGLDSATVAQEDALATPLDSISRARFNAETEAWVAGIVQRARARLPTGS